MAGKQCKKARLPHALARHGFAFLSVFHVDQHRKLWSELAGPGRFLTGFGQLLADADQRLDQVRLGTQPVGRRAFIGLGQQGLLQLLQLLRVRGRIQLFPFPIRRVPAQTAQLAGIQVEFGQATLRLGAFTICE
jgi:hypothetical protein